MPTVYVVEPARDLSSDEIAEAMELRKAVLRYGRPTLRQATGPNRIHLSGDIHKLATKTEEDAEALVVAIQGKFGCDSTISQKDYDGESITWEDDQTE